LRVSPPLREGQGNLPQRLVPGSSIRRARHRLVPSLSRRPGGAAVSARRSGVLGNLAALFYERRRDPLRSIQRLSFQEMS